MDYQNINSETVDRLVEEGWEWGIPITHETYLKALVGDWDVLLTPTKPVPHCWLGDIAGKKLLGLASGGGQQMPIFAALSADCTVLDYSDRQLDSERRVSAREGYEIKIIKADTTKPLPSSDCEFDLTFHPVSNCYIEKVEPVFKECYRILKPGGRLLSGLDNGVNFFVEDDESKIVNTLPINPLKDPERLKSFLDGDCGVQFSHTLEEQIGGQLRAGFVLKDIYEDTNGSGYLHEHNIPCFLATLSIKPEDK